MTQPLGPVLAAGRKNLLDAYTQFLAEKGAKYADEYAEQLVRIAWAQKWRPPHPASEDPVPPLRQDRCATAEQRQTHMAEIRAALNRRSSP